MGREGRDYWEEQLSEYWDSGLTIQEYSELKELPYESTRRWIRVLEKARQDGVIGSASLELVEVKSLQTDARNGSGIRLLVDGYAPSEGHLDLRQTAWYVLPQTGIMGGRHGT